MTSRDERYRAAAGRLVVERDRWRDRALSYAAVLVALGVAAAVDDLSEADRADVLRRAEALALVGRGA